jgi:hypothetical protein
MIVAAKEASMELGDGRVSDEGKILADKLTCVSGDTMFNDGFEELALFNLVDDAMCGESAESTGLCFVADAGILETGETK